MILPPPPMPALVTGGAKRIGRAITESLAAAGHPVAIHCSRSREEAEALAHAIVSQGGKAGVVQGDLARVDEMERLVAEAEEAVGPIGLLVNNASRFENDEMENLGPEEMMTHLSINLAAPCLLAAAVGRRLPAEMAGLIVNIVDQRVLKPTPQYFSYSLSKAGLWWATRTMAQAFAPRMRVVAIGPGPTLRSARQDKDAFDRQETAVLMGRGPSLDDFGRTIRWLLDTPSFTGQMIALDGGQHLAWKTADVIDVDE